VVVTHIADKQSVLEEKSLNLLASSISEIFNNELELFTELIREKLSGKATNP
jgi:endonuclease IV